MGSAKRLKLYSQKNVSGLKQTSFEKKARVPLVKSSGDKLSLFDAKTEMIVLADPVIRGMHQLQAVLWQ